MIRAGVLQRVCDMEDPSSFERVTAPRGGNDRDTVRSGVKVDDEREHQPIRNGTQGSELIRTCKSAFRVLWSSPAVDDCVACIVGRRRSGLDLFARSRDGAWGSQRGRLLYLVPLSTSNSRSVRSISLSMKLAMPAWQTLVWLRSYRTPQVSYPQVRLRMEAHTDG